MKYETFKHLIVEQLHSHFDKPKTISIQKIQKNNGIILDGLVILDCDMNIAPTLYLNYYFEKYESGTSFSEVFDELIDDYEENRPLTSVNVSFFTDFDKIKNKIVYKIINYHQNREFLKDMPYFHYLDLAIIFYCLIQSDITGNASILINNQHMIRWNVDAESLMRLAQKNTPQLLKYELRSIHSILAAETDTDTSDIYPMYVLTNTSRLNGACCILYKNLLQHIADTIDSDFFILPSSIHEVIILPAKDRSGIIEISEMVRTVNITEVSSEEVLSDHAYFFSRKDGCVSL